MLDGLFVLKVKPGETALAFYQAENPTDRPIVGISTYTVVPYRAAPYFNKIQVSIRSWHCYCFLPCHLCQYMYWTPVNCTAIKISQSLLAHCLKGWFELFNLWKYMCMVAVWKIPGFS